MCERRGRPGRPGFTPQSLPASECAGAHRLATSSVVTPQHLGLCGQLQPGVRGCAGDAGVGDCASREQLGGRPAGLWFTAALCWAVRGYVPGLLWPLPL